MKSTRANVYDVIEQIIKDPSASFWLQNALKVSMSRDILDAAADAEVLAQILAAKRDNVLNREVL